MCERAVLLESIKPCRWIPKCRQGSLRCVAFGRANPSLILAVPFFYHRSFRLNRGSVVLYYSHLCCTIGLPHVVGGCTYSTAGVAQNQPSPPDRPTSCAPALLSWDQSCLDFVVARGRSGPLFPSLPTQTASLYAYFDFVLEHYLLFFLLCCSVILLSVRPTICVAAENPAACSRREQNVSYVFQFFP